MSIVVWIIFGALAGWIASILTGTNEQQGMIGNIIIGVLGAFLGGFIANMFGMSDVNGFNLYSLLVAIFGAVVLLSIKRLFTKS